MIQAWITIGNKILDVMRDQIVDHVMEDQVAKLKKKYLGKGVQKKKTQGK